MTPKASSTVILIRWSPMTSMAVNQLTRDFLIRKYRWYRGCTSSRVYFRHLRQRRRSHRVKKWREKSIGFDLEGARKYNWIEYISREDKSGKIKIIPCFSSKFSRKVENEWKKTSSHNIYIDQAFFFKKKKKENQFNLSCSFPIDSSINISFESSLQEGMYKL